MPTMIAPLRRAVRVAPAAVAAQCGDVELTYDETGERCRRLAGALHDLGLRAGDRVAVVAANCHRYVELYQAVPGAGMVLVPLNARLTAAELRYAIEDSGARALFADRPVEAPVEHVLDAAAGHEQLIAGGSPADFPDDLPEGTVAGLFYTGGTTGASKGVMLTHRNLLANAIHWQVSWPFGADTCWLIVAPMFHAAGSMGILPTVAHAGRQVVLGAFDAAAALDLVERRRATATNVVPTMLAALSDEQLARPRDVSTLRLINHGGAPIAPATVRRAHAAFPATQLLHTYGATETSPLATLLAHEERLLDSDRGRSCGQPIPGVELAVVDPTGARLPPGAVGEVLIHGDNVMAGYWNKPAETAAAMVDGWYRSGDLGYLDEQAYLFLVDRVRDMIVSGGENVYSSEVEDVLHRHGAVREAAVFGVPHAYWGEAVHAVVVPRSPVAEEELLRHCRDALAGFKVPKRIELRDEPLPKSGAGKVLKRELRAPYWEGQATEIAGA